jgi:hypothetical protein
MGVELSPKYGRTFVAVPSLFLPKGKSAGKSVSTSFRSQRALKRSSGKNI